MVEAEGDCQDGLREAAGFQLLAEGLVGDDFTLHLVTEHLACQLAMSDMSSASLPVRRGGRAHLAPTRNPCARLAAPQRMTLQKASYPMLNVGMTIVFNPSRLVKRRSAPNISPFRRAFVSLRLMSG